MSKRWSVVVALAIASPACSAARVQPEAQPGPMMAMAGDTGCMGRDSATIAQMKVVHQLVVNHDRITRNVTNLPNGIRTVTESDDPLLAELIREHVNVNVQRVQAGDDPGLPMESAALRAMFRNSDKIRTTTEPTAKGILVVHTSADREVVAALQQHATEVTDLVARGMVAMREARMKHGGEMIGPGACPMHVSPGGDAAGHRR